ncbi:MAG: leucine-rich repeat protein [Bacillales bacterium]|nr:leucine-rich repeat protein [Bacillales bacterium]
MKRIIRGLMVLIGLIGLVSCEEVSYTITWENYDGTVLETDTKVPAGSTPTYDGEMPEKISDEIGTYTFSGWSPEVSEASADITYTATYTFWKYSDNNFIYRYLKESSSYIIFQYIGIDTEIDIPAIFNGKAVTSIGDGAFANCSSITSIVIPNSVIDIGIGAFWGCSSLTTVTIGNSVTSIGTNAFSLCGSLTTVTIGNSVTSIGSFAFTICSSLTNVTIPNSVTSIGDYAFGGCSSLTSIVIPNSVTSIGQHAFINCELLTIYCEALSQPEGWDASWNFNNIPVVWGYTGS